MLSSNWRNLLQSAKPAAGHEKPAAPAKKASLKPSKKKRRTLAQPVAAAAAEVDAGDGDTDMLPQEVKVNSRFTAVSDEAQSSSSSASASAQQLPLWDASMQHPNIPISSVQPADLAAELARFAAVQTLAARFDELLRPWRLGFNKFNHFEKWLATRRLDPAAIASDPVLPCAANAASSSPAAGTAGGKAKAKLSAQTSAAAFWHDAELIGKLQQAGASEQQAQSSKRKRMT